MAIGLEMLRAAGRGRRAGRLEEDREDPRSTVREVCLVGLDRRSRDEDWPAGREVVWLGRTYQVRAAAGDGPEPPCAGAGLGPIGPVARRYIHLTPRDGN